MQAFDIAIVGAGPSGLSVAVAAQKAGLTCIVLEKGALVNSIYHFPTQMTFFSTSEKLEMADVPFISHSDKPSRSEALEYYRRIAQSFKLPVTVYTTVHSVQKLKDQLFLLQSSKGDFQARNVVLATGYYGLPRLLEVPGEDLPKVRHYYDDPHLYIGQKVLVIGAANSACDVALETWMKGAEVSMAIRQDKIYEKVKYWIKPNIENRIAEGSIKAFFNTTVERIEPKSVWLQTPDGRVCIENDFVLAMTGYQPDYTFLAQCGLTFTNDAERKPRFDEQSLESVDVAGLYVAGVINAGMATSKLFIENTRHHGELIVTSILEKRTAAQSDTNRSASAFTQPVAPLGKSAR